MLSTYTPIDVFGTRWGLIAEIDESEAMAAVVDMRATASSAGSKLLTWVSALGVIAAAQVSSASQQLAEGARE